MKPPLRLETQFALSITVATVLSDAVTQTGDVTGVTE